ncbi:hypothetical protein ACLK2C_18650 [Escherichia coli]
MTNPLLTPFELPPFSKILPEHVVPAVTKALNDCRENVERVVAQGAPYTWENLCQPLAEVDDVLGRIFSPVSHLNSVKNSPELREAYEQTLPLLSEYSTWVGQHEGLYKAYRDLRDGDHYATLNTAQKKAVDNALRDFELSGIGLPKEKQQRYGEIRPASPSWPPASATTCWMQPRAGTSWWPMKPNWPVCPNSVVLLPVRWLNSKAKRGGCSDPAYPLLPAGDDVRTTANCVPRWMRPSPPAPPIQAPMRQKRTTPPIMSELLTLRRAAQLLGLCQLCRSFPWPPRWRTRPKQVVRFLTDLAAKSLPQGKAELEEDPPLRPAEKAARSERAGPPGISPTTPRSSSNTSFPHLR